MEHPAGVPGPRAGRRSHASRCSSVARADGRHRYLHAYPKVAHAASNAICRKAGFTLLGEVDFEYPKGVPIRCNDWRYDLHQS